MKLKSSIASLSILDSYVLLYAFSSAESVTSIVI